MKRIIYIFLSIIILVFLISACTKISSGKNVISFEKEVLPIFKNSCGVCHKREGGNEHAVKNKVYYELKEDILAKVGSFIIAGNPEESALLKVASSKYPVGERKIIMPPQKSKITPLTEKEINTITAWIAEGAQDN